MFSRRFLRFWRHCFLQHAPHLQAPPQIHRHFSPRPKQPFPVRIDPRAKYFLQLAHAVLRQSSRALLADTWLARQPHRFHTFQRHSSSTAPTYPPKSSPNLCRIRLTSKLPTLIPYKTEFDPDLPNDLNPTTEQTLWRNYEHVHLHGYWLRSQLQL